MGSQQEARGVDEQTGERGKGAGLQVGWGWWAEQAEMRRKQAAELVSECKARRTGGRSVNGMSR